MNFHKNLRLVPSGSRLAIPFMDIVVQAVCLFLIVSILSHQSTFGVRMPRAVTSDISREDMMTLLISGEDVMYLDGKLVTGGELRGALAQAQRDRKTLLIKCDRRASVGRIVEVWDLARGLGLERVDLATDQGD